MNTIIEKLIDCSAITAAECSDKILAALGHSVGFNLKAATPDDTVHGWVSITHNDAPLKHVVEIECYEADEAPTAVMVRGELVGRRSTLACCDPMPTEKALRDKIGAL